MNISDEIDSLTTVSSAIRSVVTPNVFLTANKSGYAYTPDGGQIFVIFNSTASDVVISGNGYVCMYVPKGLKYMISSARAFFFELN